MDGYVDLVDDLLALREYNGEDVNVEEEPVSQVSAVDLVIEGNVEGLAELLRDDPNFAVNARSPKTGRSLLHEACARGQMEIVKFLLQKTDADLMLRTMLVRLKKHAVESVTSFAESIWKDHRIGVAERDAAMESYKILIKYLEKQAEAEYRVKLESLRQLKKQTKEQAAVLAASVSRKRSKRRMSSGSPRP
ncbi:unnamed protein product [Phytophthora lilii]|uniref:Unnamed protein product n=1 Tax=Phytophthora lilii TaxID=2077276 RepID=A0A9W6WVW1_9STRA|nr:unnamed protein product [Phytophthora lilii]